MATPERRSELSVALRPAVARDADFLWRWRAEWSVRRFQPLHDLSAGQLRNDVANQRIGDLYRGQGEKFQWIVLSEGQPAGWINLVVSNWEHGLAEVGYALSPDHQGKGVMRRALTHLLDDAFRHTPIERIEARCAADNTPSQRVLERCGFRFEGRLRSYFKLRGRRVDNLLYAILKTDVVSP